MKQPTRDKILLLLLSGVALGFAYSPNRYRKILRITGKEWKRINEEELRRGIRNCYRSKLIKEKDNPDGTTTIELTEKGKMRVLTYDFNKMEIKQKEWDRKWRAVIFDIPEKLRWGRDSLRKKLKNLGFCEFQKSVFVHPYDCRDEIEYLIEFYDIRKFARFLIAESVDNELHLKQHFNLA